MLAEETPATDLTPEVDVSDNLDYLYDIGDDTSPGEDPPLPTDDAKPSVAAPQDKPEEVAKPEEKPEEVAKPDESGKVEDVDPDLTDEENESVNSLPKPARQQARRHAKEAKLYQDVLNPAKSGEEIRQRLHALSGSRAEEVERAVINARAADPEKFFSDLDPETYGKVVTASYESDQPTWNKIITGREGVSQADIREALEFKDKYRDRVDSGDGLVLTDDEAKDLETFFPEKAEQIKEALKAANQPKPAEAKTEVKAEEKKDEAATPADPQSLSPEQSKVWSSAYTHAESFLTSKLESELGLSISKQEWDSAPNVARAKQAKLDLMLNGGGTLQPFMQGFVEWGKENPKFKEVIDSMAHYSRKGEEPNAKAAADRLKPFIDKYANERAKSAEYQYYDGLSQLQADFPQLSFAEMKAILSKAIKTNSHDTHIPGAANAGTKTRKADPDARLTDILMDV